MQQTDNETAGDLSLRPLGTRILVEQKPWQEKLESGLYIPQGSREGYEDQAVVRAVGLKVTTDVKPGDRVLFKRRAGSAIVPDVREGDANGWKNFLMLQEDDLIAVIED